MASANRPALPASHEGRQSAGMATRRHYIDELIAYIEAHRYYPLAARRRQIEGTVEVRFLVDKTGRVSDLQVAGSHEVLNRAARKTLARAMPMPGLPQGIEGPLKVSYRMRFKIEG